MTWPVFEKRAASSAEGGTVRLRVTEYPALEPEPWLSTLAEARSMSVHFHAAR